MLGIIGAMQMEVDELKHSMTDRMSWSISGMEFVQGKLDGRDVVTVVCGAGKVAAAVCAQTLILAFGANGIINTGVAGTLCTDLGISDVAIASDVVQHDMDTTAIGDALGEIPGTGLVHLPCDPRMVALLEQAVGEQGLTSRTGTVATGDMFLHTQERKQFIVDQFGAIAGEMEGGAVGQVCVLNRVPFAVLRTISDDASGGAPESFETFAAQASHVGCGIVRRFVTLWRDGHGC